MWEVRETWITNRRPQAFSLRKGRTNTSVKFATWDLEPPMEDSGLNGSRAVVEFIIPNETPHDVLYLSGFGPVHTRCGGQSNIDIACISTHNPNEL